MPVFAYRPETAWQTRRYLRDQRAATANSQPTPFGANGRPRLLPTKLRSRRRQSTDDFVAREKLGDFDCRRLRGIGTMYRIFTDRPSVQLADRTIGRLGRIGCAHDVTMPEHGIFAFENLNHHRRGNHEIHQLAKERARLVDGVEGFGLFAGHADALLRNDAKSG